MSHNLYQHGPTVMRTASLHPAVRSSSVTSCLLHLCQLIQFDELILEFDHGMCDDAGRQGGPRSRGSRAGVVELSMSASRRSMRRETAASAGMSSKPKSLKALNTGSPPLVIVASSLSQGAMEARWPQREDDRKTCPRVEDRSRLSAVSPCIANPSAPARRPSLCGFPGLSR